MVGSFLIGINLKNKCTSCTQKFNSIFLDEIEPSIHTNHGVKIDPKRIIVDNPTEEEYEQQAMIDDWIEFGQFEFKPFVFGVKVDQKYIGYYYIQITLLQSLRVSVMIWESDRFL